MPLVALLKTIIDLNDALVKNENITVEEINSVYEHNIDNSSYNLKRNKMYVIKKTLVNQNSYSKIIKSEFHPYCNPKGC